MVQLTAAQFWRIWQDILQALPNMLWILILAVLILGLFLWIYREGVLKMLPSLQRSGGLFGRVLALLAVLALAVFGLNVVKQSAVARIQAQERAEYSSRAQLTAGDSVQYGPAVNYLDEHSYQRSLTLPPEILAQVREEGLGVLSPYLLEPNAQDLIQLADTFRRSGRNVVFTRTSIQTVEQPIALQSANIKVDLHFPDPTSNSYLSTFTGTYRFSNPLKVPVTGRFTFSLPSGVGTVSNFKMLVNGKNWNLADLSQGYRWEDQMPMGAKMEIVVQYQQEGSNTWSYDLSGRREAIQDFNVLITSNRTAKFARDALYPNRFMGNSWGWSLQNVLTWQSIRLAFVETSLRETLQKILTFAPLTLLLAVAWSALLLWQKPNICYTPISIALAILGFALGLASIGILSAYMPLVWAGILGALWASAAAIWILGPTLLWPVVGSALAPLCFLSGGHAGLLLSLLVALVLLTVYRPQWPKTSTN